jgi:hypothetical protein
MKIFDGSIFRIEFLKLKKNHFFSSKFLPNKIFCVLMKFQKYKKKSTRKIPSLKYSATDIYVFNLLDN